MKKHIGAVAAILIGCVVVVLAIRAGHHHSQCRECNLVTAIAAK